MTGGVAGVGPCGAESGRAPTPPVTLTRLLVISDVKFEISDLIEDLINRNPNRLITRHSNVLLSQQFYPRVLSGTYYLILQVLFNTRKSEPDIRQELA